MKKTYRIKTNNQELFHDDHKLASKERIMKEIAAPGIFQMKCEKAFKSHESLEE